MTDLSSIRVFLTRPEARNGTVPERLRDLGVGVVELPALSLRPLPVPHHFPAPQDYDMVVFVSRYAAARYIQILTDAALAEPQWPATTLAATVGASSARALRNAGFIPAESIVHPPPTDPAQDSESLVRTLQERHLHPERVLIVRGTRGRPWLAETLAVQGANVDFLAVYERAPAQWSEGLARQLADALHTPEYCIFLITSGEGVHALAKRMSEAGLMQQWSKASFIVIHERIAATLQSVLDTEAGAAIRPIELCRPDDNAIVETIHAVAKRSTRP